MTDKDNNEGGIHLTKDGFNCLPCRCRRNLYHKETVKTTDENNITTINIVEDRSSFKMGRGITPDNNIFKPEENQLGSVAICDTGWNRGKQITPEELEQRVDKLEIEVEKIEEGVERIDKSVKELKNILLIV